jgi:hypothetical protein
MKETIISISKPVPKVQAKPIEDDPQPEITQAEEISLFEELQQQQPIDFTPPASTSFISTSHGGWKVSDILREIRLDNFDMANLD